jgi:Sec7-like guanine-nucleotide exchange factor
LEYFFYWYYECNPSEFSGTDECFSLTFAVVLLNTDLHSEGVENKMSVSDFVKNFKTLHPGGSWSEERLKKVYYSIKKCELSHPRHSRFYKNCFCRPDSLAHGAAAETSRSLSSKIKTLLRQERGKGVRFSTITGADYATERHEAGGASFLITCKGVICRPAGILQNLLFLRL